MRLALNNVPVKMFWKASSTLLASKAEVSMKERLLSPASAICQFLSLHALLMGNALTRKLLGLLGGNSPKVPQIALVSHQHNNDVAVRVVSQLFQPSRDVLICLVFADVVHEQRTDCTTVVGRSDGAVALLARGIPDLGFDGLGIHLDRSSSEFYANSRLGIEVEFVPSESTEKVGFTDAGVSNEDH